MLLGRWRLRFGQGEAASALFCGCAGLPGGSVAMEAGLSGAEQCASLRSILNDDLKSLSFELAA